MLCMRNSCVDVSGSVPVYLNVYDISPINGYAYWLGLGVYHSGVQVHGVEYAYGAHEHPSTGIFEGLPKKGEGFTFRKGILVGWTELEPQDVKKEMEEFAEKYRGNAYNLITNNCNHFCNDVCTKLTGNRIPGWVNRLARIGFLCNCVIPERITMAKIRCHKNEEKEKVIEEDKKVEIISSKRLTNSSNSSSSSSSPPSDSATIGSKSTRSTTSSKIEKIRD